MKCHPLATICPSCGQYNNHVTESIGGPPRAMPTDGDYSVCMNCYTVTVFVNSPFGLATRETTMLERLEAYADPEVREAIRLLREDHP